MQSWRRLWVWRQILGSPRTSSSLLVRRMTEIYDRSTSIWFNLSRQAIRSKDTIYFAPKRKNGLQSVEFDYFDKMISETTLLLLYRWWYESANSDRRPGFQGVTIKYQIIPMGNNQVLNDCKLWKRFFRQQTRSDGNWAELSWEAFPHVGLSKVYRVMMVMVMMVIMKMMVIMEMMVFMEMIMTSEIRIW